MYMYIYVYIYKSNAANSIEEYTCISILNTLVKFGSHNQITKLFYKELKSQVCGIYIIVDYLSNYIIYMYVIYICICS
jgi:hypothetical protein